MLRKKSRSVQRGAVVLLLALVTILAGWAGGNWADAPAALTIAEYLDVQFKLAMQRPESGALNSFSLVSFCPSLDPQSALVFVIQTWRDERLETQDLRRAIRNVGEALTNHFDAMAGQPFVSKRWKIANPKANIVVRHVRFSDLRETLAVTLNGETVFDEDRISKAEAQATARGAVWGW